MTSVRFNRDGFGINIFKAGDNVGNNLPYFLSIQRLFVYLKRRVPLHAASILYPKVFRYLSQKSGSVSKYLHLHTLLLSATLLRTVGKQIIMFKIKFPNMSRIIWRNIKNAICCSRHIPFPVVHYHPFIKTRNLS